MLERVKAVRPEARLDGLLVQEMVQRPSSIELIAGFSVDRVFGPVIVFGQGGIAVEVVGDTALELPPLNMAVAGTQMQRTRIWRLLQCYRGHPPADIDAIAAVLVRISQLAIPHGEICELDINPLVVDASGVIALDARIGVERCLEPPTKRLAILPYPEEFQRIVPLGDGASVGLRPVRPEDAPLLEDLLTHIKPADARLLFFAPRQEPPPLAAARLSQIDYDRQMTLIARLPDSARVFGIARLSADPDNRLARFAVAVSSDLRARPIGPLLIASLLLRLPVCEALQPYLVTFLALMLMWRHVAVRSDLPPLRTQTIPSWSACGKPSARPGLELTVPGISRRSQAHILRSRSREHHERRPHGWHPSQCDRGSCEAPRSGSDRQAARCVPDMLSGGRVADCARLGRSAARVQTSHQPSARPARRAQYGSTQARSVGPTQRARAADAEEECPTSGYRANPGGRR